MEWQRQVGSNVRRLRKAAGLTQEALAYRAGLAMRYVSGIERGEENPSLAALVKLAAALEAHPRDLFADQG
jgi:transcriptional regulator with XRE-family HTH domain